LFHGFKRVHDKVNRIRRIRTGQIDCKGSVKDSHFVLKQDEWLDTAEKPTRLEEGMGMHGTQLAISSLFAKDNIRFNWNETSFQSV
jgi:hypothetical protein